MKSELQTTEKCPKVEIDRNSLKVTLKKVVSWKISGQDTIHRFWFKRFTSVNNSLAQQLNTYESQEYPNG